MNNDNKLPLQLDITVTRENLHEVLFDILQKVRPAWTDFDAVKIKDLSSNGYINTNIACYVGDEIADDAVVIRIFEAEMLQHFRHDIFSGFRLINRHGLSPRVLCELENGVCMAFQPGISPTWKTAKLLQIKERPRSVAHELARYHSRDLYAEAVQARIAEKFVGVDPEWFIYRWEILKSNSNLPQSFTNLVPSMDVLSSEIQHLEQLLHRLNSPRRFCHMDVNPTNIIYNEKEERAIIIDYENPCIYFVACELAWYFLTHGDINNMDYAEYPDESYRRKFLTNYLEKRRKVEGLNDVKVTSEDLELLLKHTEVSYLLMLIRMTIVAYVVGSYEPPHASVDMMTKVLTSSWKEYHRLKQSTLDSVKDEKRWMYNGTYI